MAIMVQDIVTDRLRRAGWLVCTKLVDARNAFWCMQHDELETATARPFVKGAESTHWSDKGSGTPP